METEQSAGTNPTSGGTRTRGFQRSTSSTADSGSSDSSSGTDGRRRGGRPKGYRRLADGSYGYPAADSGRAEGGQSVSTDQVQEQTTVHIRKPRKVRTKVDNVSKSIEDRAEKLGIGFYALFNLGIATALGPKWELTNEEITGLAKSGSAFVETLPESDWKEKCEQYFEQYFAAGFFCINLAQVIIKRVRTDEPPKAKVTPFDRQRSQGSSPGNFEDSETRQDSGSGVRAERDHRFSTGVAS